MTNEASCEMSLNCHKKPVAKNESASTVSNMRKHFQPISNLNQETSIVMKNHQLIRPLFALAVAALFANAPTAQANSLAGPTAILQITFTGGGKRDFISTPFVRTAEKTGTVASVPSTNTITLTDSQSATYANNLFTPGTASQDNKYILEILDGPMIGLVAYIKSNTGNTLTVDEAELPTTGQLTGSKFAIRKDWTIESLLGAASASSPFASGSSSASADNINVFNPKTQSYSTYFVRFSSGSYSWRDPIGNLSNHLRIPYGQGVQVLRRAAGNGSITLTGEVRTARLRRDIPNGKYGLIANLSPSPTTLGDLNISITRANNQNGDVVKVWNSGTASWTAYNRRTSDGQFRDSGNLNNRDGIVIAPGRVVQVVNKSGSDRKGLTAITADPRLP